MEYGVESDQRGCGVNRIKVRRADYQDIPRIMDLCREAHSVSQYADTIPIDPIKQHKALSRIIAPSRKDTAAFVLSDSDRNIYGITLAISEFYWFSPWKYATDIMTYARRSARGRGVQLYHAFTTWAERQPKCVEACLTISSDIVDRERVERLYELLGYERNGHVWSRYWHEKMNVRQVA